MLKHASQCDPQRLQQLLNGQLSEQAETAVAEHLETCATCRRELEFMAAKKEWWVETHELLSGWSSTDATGRIHAPGHRNPCASVPAADSPSLRFLAPSDNPAMLGRLGEFEVLEVIGRGGMGVVLKGYDHELNRFVAIKVLGAHYAENAAARRRFAREAQAAAAVVHQHVVAIYAVDPTHQPPFFVMPFVPGESLQQRLDRSGPLGVAEVLRIGQQVAEGLAAAHAQGLIHRDIKPANILLERNVERVLLTDFGLARAVDDASLTQSGVIAGTPQYMSPEQARGDVIDHRTDLFSLGSVLYALLAGHPPFRADSPYAVLRRVNDDVPRSLREVNSQVPDWMEGFISRLLSKKPEDRWQTAREMADVLKECLAHIQQPTAIALPNSVNILARRLKKQTSYMTAAIAVLVIGALSLTYIVYKRAKFEPQQRTEVTDGTVASAKVKQTSPSDKPLTVPNSVHEWSDGLIQEVKAAEERLRLLERESEF
jgi:serine/threonine protein kinase